MSRGLSTRLLAVAGALAVLATACGGSPRNPSDTASAVATPSASAPAPTTGIQPTAFGMHFLRWREVPWPDLAFGSMRISDMWVRWTDLQPKATTKLDPATNGVLQRLDAIVADTKARGAAPLFVLAGTPRWAADDCPHGSWPIPTCGPRRTGLSSPWATYVRFLAKRYGPAWFETWNEPNLRNGWNDTTAKLAAMQKTASTIIHRANPANRLLSPSVAITAGHPIRYLRTLFALPGGKSFDVFAIHLYPSDAAAKAGNGPEWAVDYLRRQVRPLLRANHIGAAVWDTETNVGRTYQGLSFTGMRGAAMVTRTYVLQLSSNVRRIFWYAADDRRWTGTALLRADLRTLTDAGRAYNFTQWLLLGATPLGCSHTTSATTVAYTCAFRLRTGEHARVGWTTKGTTTTRVRSFEKRASSPTGRTWNVAPGAQVVVTAVPTWIVG